MFFITVLFKAVLLSVAGVCSAVRQLRATVAGELLGDTDRRLPLPGGLGLAEELSPPLPPPPPPAERRRPGNDTAAELLHDRHMAVSGEL